MNNRYTFPVLLLLMIGIIVFVMRLAKPGSFLLFDPHGVIALEERSLFIIATLFMLLIGVLIYAFTIVIAWRYRADNTKAAYTPNWEHSLVDEFIWWLVPGVIIFFLALLTWRSTHQLDPFKPLSSETTPLTIQVVALNWKWLFIYPTEHIASVNLVAIPTGVPIDFQITADAPMNSFWIPELGGQIYAMPGMNTKLNLMADQEGTYHGSSANFSGQGFSGMRFDVRAESMADFDAWVRSVRAASTTLDVSSYKALAEPSEYVPISTFGSVQNDLYTMIVDTFMKSAHGSSMNAM